MHIVTRGTGPALALVHGWAMHGGLFAPLIDRLQQHFTLHIVDLPGHGRSQRSPLPLELDAVASALVKRIPRALWLGWSLGGLVALHTAQQWPESARGVIMLCASPRFVRGEDWPLGMDASVFSGFADDLAHDPQGTLDRFLLLETQGSTNARDELDALRKQVFAHGEPSEQTLQDGLALLRYSDLRPRLPGLAAASLWIAGRRDRLVSAHAMQAAAALTPRSRFLRIESGGHAPFLTHTEDVANAILAFARDLVA